MYPAGYQTAPCGLVLDCFSVAFRNKHENLRTGCAMDQARSSQLLLYCVEFCDTIELIDGSKPLSLNWYGSFLLTANRVL